MENEMTDVNEETLEEEEMAAEPVEIPPVPPPSRPPLGYGSRHQTQLKTPTLAAVLSAAPGMGNIYNGLYARGFGFFLIFVSLIVLAANATRDTEVAFLAPSIIFFWFFNLFDAYRQATLINMGGRQEPLMSNGGNLGRATLFPGVVLLVIGTYGLLRKYLDLDLSWVFEQWPFFVIAAGGFLVYSAMKAKPE